MLGAAAAVYAAQEGLTTVTGLAGGDRRSTGSHEVGSFRPAAMPTVIWLNDRRPEQTDEATWPLVVDGRPTTIASLRARARPVVATLDCTGGWWSEQSWDAVRSASLIPEPTGRSIRVASQTGYDRLVRPTMRSTTSTSPSAMAASRCAPATARPCAWSRPAVADRGGSSG